MRSRLGIPFLVLVSLVASSAGRAEPVGSIRVTDRGPFRVWNGFDADAPRGSGQRVLAVAGAMKSIRVTYAASMSAPQVTTGAGFAEIVPGPGTVIDFGGPRDDCHSDTIVYCSNDPIRNYPPGTILCMCTRQPGAICCTADTGVLLPRSMTPIDIDL